MRSRSHTSENGLPISLPNGLPYSNKIIIDKKRGDESKGDCKGVAVKRESNNASATTGADKPRKRRRPSPASPTPRQEHILTGPAIPVETGAATTPVSA